MTGPHSNDLTPHADGLDAARDPHGEPLSAMMDGTLSDDESRFLLRRMQHDAELAGRWERWQFYGDAMRGSAGRALPADFSRRVALAIAAEAQTSDGQGLAMQDLSMLDAVAGDPLGRTPAAQRAAVARTRRPLLRWGGGAALAASVVFAAIVGLRPDAAVAPDAAAPMSGSAVVDAAPAAPSPVIASPQTGQASNPATLATAGTRGQNPQSDSIRSASSAAPFAAATTPAAIAAGSEPSGRSSQALSTGRASTASSSLVLAAQPERSAASPALDFGRALGDDETPLNAKPWPRSPLLQGAMDDGVMVDYGRGGGLILGRPVQAPRSESPLLSPPIFARPSGQAAPASSDAGPGADAADAGSGDADDTPR